MREKAAEREALMAEHDIHKKVKEISGILIDLSILVCSNNKIIVEGNLKRMKNIYI